MNTLNLDLLDNNMYPIYNINACLYYKNILIYINSQTWDIQYSKKKKCGKIPYQIDLLSGRYKLDYWFIQNLVFPHNVGCKYSYSYL